MEPEGIERSSVNVTVQDLACPLIRFRQTGVHLLSTPVPRDMNNPMIACSLQSKTKAVIVVIRVPLF